MLRSVETHPAFLDLFDEASAGSLPCLPAGRLGFGSPSGFFLALPAGRYAGKDAERPKEDCEASSAPAPAWRAATSPQAGDRQAPCVLCHPDAGRSVKAMPDKTMPDKTLSKDKLRLPSATGLPGAPRRSPRERAERPRPQAACGLPGSAAVAFGCVLTSCLLQATVRLVLSGICLPGAIRSCHSGGGVP